MNKTLLSLTVTLALVALPATAQSVVNWGLGAQNISSVDDVSTGGSLVAAYNFGPSGVSSTTVNGVTFLPFAVPANYTANTVTVGNITLNESVGQLTSYNNLGSGAVPASTLASEYQALISSAASADNAATLTLVMGGLTLGQNYLFQCWVNNSSFVTSLNGTAFSTTATAGNSVFIDDNTSNANGGVGRFATGIFTASGTSQSIDFNGVGFNDPLVNAFQLRAAVGAVPEPSTYALAAFGAGSFLVLRRFRKQSV